MYQGDVGAAGPVGPRGERGLSGPRGRPGLDGRPGNPKGFGSADCDTIYTIYPSVHNQQTRTLFKGRSVKKLLLD